MQGKGACHGAKLPVVHQKNRYACQLRSRVIARRYPSQCRVRQAVPNFVDMREPAANETWKQTLVELGLIA
jgi:hypothetical protein